MESCRYLDWEDYFMSVAFLSGMRSKDPCSQVGACIVNSDNIIVSIGYNGMPRGCSDDELPWGKMAEDKLNTKYMYVCHAEMNAVVNKNSADVAGCTMYVVLFPCNECAKIVIQSRIKEVVYYSNKHKQKPETIASIRMLNMAAISFRQHSPKFSRFDINFNLNEKTCNNFSEIENCSQDCLQNLEELHLNSHPMNADKKRLDYLAWEEYFMALVFLTAQRSKDPAVKLGACIVNQDKKIVGIGYNGMPRRCDDSALPWTNKAGDEFDSKDMYICHAEMNAILNKNCAKIKGCTMYVIFFPCNECAKFIIQEEIKELIYYSAENQDTTEVKAAKKILEMAGVKWRTYIRGRTSVPVDFDSIDWNRTTQLPPTPQKIRTLY